MQYTAFGEEEEIRRGEEIKKRRGGEIKRRRGGGQTSNVSIHE
jgi:hypothetical protein